MLRGTLVTIIFFVFLGLCLFAPAKRIAWGMAWACLGVFGTVTAASFLLADPDLLRERAAPGPGVERGDVALATLGFIGLYPGILVVAGLDAGRSTAASSIPITVDLLALGISYRQDVHRVANQLIRTMRNTRVSGPSRPNRA